MDFKDYYAALGLDRTVAQDDIKRAYRKLARKYHPDLSKEPDAEARFKDVAEAYEALKDGDKRAAYDEVASRHRSGERFNPAPGWDSGFEFSGGEAYPRADASHSDFFEALFGSQREARASGGDRHAKVQIDLEDAYRGARRSVSLRTPVLDAQGHVTLRDRQLDVNIPKGVRAGQHLRLAGQGDAARGDGPAGDLFLEIEFAPHPRFRVDGRDVYVALPVAPWEAALGARVTTAIPDGEVELAVPRGSAAGRKLRLKGKGLPGTPPGDLYAVLSIALPAPDTAPAEEAYRAMAKAFAQFDPRNARLAS